MTTKCIPNFFLFLPLSHPHISPTRLDYKVWQSWAISPFPSRESHLSFIFLSSEGEGVMTWDWQLLITLCSLRKECWLSELSQFFLSFSHLLLFVLKRVTLSLSWVGDINKHTLTDISFCRFHLLLLIFSSLVYFSSPFPLPKKYGESFQRHTLTHSFFLSSPIHHFKCVRENAQEQRMQVW